MQDIPNVAPRDQAIVVETGAKPRAAVIWLHGLGADGQDFVPVVPELGLTPDFPIRFIFPHAPKIPVTWNGGMVMRAWYDIVSIDENQRHADDDGVKASCDYIATLIAEQNALGIPTDKIVIAGFSQGAAMAYTVGLTHPEALAGVIALSGYVPAPDLVTTGLSMANLATPIFAAHGNADNVVPLSLGSRARDAVQNWGFSIAWHVYPMAHSVCLEELHDIGRYLNQRFA